MGVLSGYLRLQIVLVTAVVLAMGAVAVLTAESEPLGLLALFGLVVAGFAALAVLLRLR